MLITDAKLTELGRRSAALRQEALAAPAPTAVRRWYHRLVRGREPSVATGGPIALNDTQEQLVREWAADDRLWNTQPTVEFNLRIFARAILAASQQCGGASAPNGEVCDGGA